jgi:hypothetical protein
VKYFIDLTVRNMVNVIESKSPSTNLLIFFPSAIMMSALAFVIVASYLVERKTEYMTLGMVAAMSIERLCSWVLMIYTSAIYISQGLGEVKVLCIIHGVSIGILLFVNTLVVFKFRSIFEIGKKDQENLEKEKVQTIKSYADWSHAYPRSFNALQCLSSAFTFHLLRFPDTRPFGLPSLSHSLYLPATPYHAFLGPPTYLTLATSLALLCLDLFHLYSLPASRLSCLVLEHALLTALSLALFYAQTRRDLAAKLSLYQATLKKSVEINHTMMLQLNKTNVTHPNATGEETM